MYATAGESRLSLQYIGLYDSEGRLIKESNGLEYIYDESGIAGIIHNGTPYLYRKTAQGDIIGLIDNAGRVVIN